MFDKMLILSSDSIEIADFIFHYLNFVHCIVSVAEALFVIIPFVLMYVSKQATAFTEGRIAFKLCTTMKGAHEV